MGNACLRARSARLLACLVALLVFLQFRQVLFLLAQIGGARPAAFGRPRVIAKALALLRLGGLLLVLEVGFLEPQRRPALLGLDRAAAGFAVIAVDSADTGNGTSLSLSRRRPSATACARRLEGEKERGGGNWPLRPSIATGSWL